VKIAYCDCFSGISGDMFLASLIDAGLPLEHLKASVEQLHLPDAYTLESSETHKKEMRATLFRVATDVTQSHPRHLAEIRALIGDSDLSSAVKEKSMAVFDLLARAEARVHGVAVEEVHFHEVGAVDSIVDIVGAAIGLDYLGIERLYASALPDGSGQIRTQHGVLPLPAPATLEVAHLAGIPLRPVRADSELVTPTGAAILGALATFEQPAMRLTAMGVGAGQRDLDWPNIMRLLIGESSEGSGDMILMETNIDDMNPQIYDHVMGRLFAAGALDVYLTPVHMKKNRPGIVLAVIARRSEEQQLAHLILEETSTLGLRVQPVRRYEAQRTVRTVSTAYGDVPLKLKIIDGVVVQAAPEYDVCVRLADAHHVPFARVYAAALAAARAME
jgi:uncharacterized protein (TIGR00299 family) protein